jgi:hypothetical protein
MPVEGWSQLITKSQYPLQCSVCYGRSTQSSFLNQTRFSCKSNWITYIQYIEYTWFSIWMNRITFLSEKILKSLEIYPLCDQMTI